MDPRSEREPQAATLRILILNWRCPTNPAAGGAEIVTHQIARRLVEHGDTVEWFSSTYPGCSAEELIDGIRIIRAGHQWTVHWHAFRKYRNALARNFDVLIDEVNTVPFFAPLWADVPVVMFIHQLAREVWWYESRFPISALGFAAEPLYLRLYQRVPAVTVSQSTRSDLLNLGFKGPISVMPEGLESVPQIQAFRRSEASFLYVGRLARSKRVSDILSAFATFVRQGNAGRLTLIGDGADAYVRELRSRAAELEISDRVRFLGRVSTEQKHVEMASSHMLLLASVREGWGLVVTEANAFGTPAVAYDVPGLRDSIRHGETGVLVDCSPESLAQGMLELWRDPQKLDRLSSAAQAWSRGFSYDESAEALRGALLSSIANRGDTGEGGPTRAQGRPRPFPMQPK